MLSRSKINKYSNLHLKQPVSKHVYSHCFGKSLKPNYIYKLLLKQCEVNQIEKIFNSHCCVKKKLDLEFWLQYIVTKDMNVNISCAILILRGNYSDAIQLLKYVKNFTLILNVCLHLQNKIFINYILTKYKVNVELDTFLKSIKYENLDIINCLIPFTSCLDNLTYIKSYIEYYSINGDNYKFVKKLYNLLHGFHNSIILSWENIFIYSILLNKKNIYKTVINHIDLDQKLIHKLFSYPDITYISLNAFYFIFNKTFTFINYTNYLLDLNLSSKIKRIILKKYIHLLTDEQIEYYLHQFLKTTNDIKLVQILVQKYQHKISFFTCIELFHLGHINYIKLLLNYNKIDLQYIHIVNSIVYQDLATIEKYFTIEQLIYIAIKCNLIKIMTCYKHKLFIFPITNINQLKLMDTDTVNVNANQIFLTSVKNNNNNSKEIIYKIIKHVDKNLIENLLYFIDDFKLLKFLNDMTDVDYKNYKELNINHINFKLLKFMVTRHLDLYSKIINKSVLYHILSNYTNKFNFVLNKL